MTNRVLKVAVTGLGVSRGYVPNYVNAPETQLGLVHDINPERAREVAEEFHASGWTTDYQEVLGSDADIVDVSTPNQFHAEQTVAALEAGKHVFCQKPMAPTVQDCKLMVETSHRTGNTLGMCMIWLNNPIAEDLRTAIAEGCLGQISSVRIRNAHCGPLNWKDKDRWRSEARYVGGGSFIQLGVHPLNLALWIVQDEILSVMGYAKNLHCRHSLEGEDVVCAAAELKNGPLLTLESGYSSQGKAIEIYGTEGQVIMHQKKCVISMARDFIGKKLVYRCSDAADQQNGGDLEVALGDIRGGRNCEFNQNRAFACAILAGKEPPVPGEIGLRDVAVVKALYRSAEEGRRVTVREILETDDV